MVIACATVIEEMLPILPPNIGYHILDFGLHTSPPRLRQALQQAIDEVSQTVGTIILGYGLCSQGVIGLSASNCLHWFCLRLTIILPFSLAPVRRTANRSNRETGTYYLTKGWIEVGDSPFTEYNSSRTTTVRARPPDNWYYVKRNYKRLALINTGLYRLERTEIMLVQQPDSLD